MALQRIAGSIACAAAPIAESSPMRKTIPSRWIEVAEARAVLEQAALHRAASEPHVSGTYSRAGVAGFEWLRALGRMLGGNIAEIRSLPVNSIASMRARFRAASGCGTAELDDDRVLIAIVITDIVDSTKRVAEIGDRAWRVLLDLHGRATRDQIKRFGGSEFGSRGDGFMSIFDSPTRAVRCAAAIADRVAPLGILLRCGVHVGEVHLNSNEISGLAAHIAARIVAAAGPGEALVSKVVRDLTVGSGLVFEDRGVHQLRGLPEEIHLYASAAAPSLTTNVVSFEPKLV
jgi:class 3 adenylate cyclase